MEILPLVCTQGCVQMGNRRLGVHGTQIGKRDSGFSGLGFQGTGFKTFVSEDSPRKTPLGSRGMSVVPSFGAVGDARGSFRIEICRFRV